MAKRERGFYWVKYRDEYEVAFFEAGTWLLCGCDLEYNQREFKEIGERIERN